MAKDAEQLMNDFLALPETELREFKRRSIHAFYADAPPHESVILEAWYDEAERILAAVNAGSEKTVSWESMKR